MKDPTRTTMSKQHLFLDSLLLLLSFFQPVATGHCQLYPRSTCRKPAPFVPGYNFIGEGVDITTLARKGAYVVDASQWHEPNGTCTLCQNPRMDGQLQRLPLTSVDWRAHGNCDRPVSSSVENSDVDVAHALAKDVSNNWEIELGLHTEASNDWPKELVLSKAQVAFAGSQSRMTLNAYEKSLQDRYSFVMQQISCEYYQLRLKNRPRLSQYFSHALKRLPRKSSLEEYQQFINIYGTHYISHVRLGGRVRHLFAVRTCAMALAGFTISDIENCLKWNVSVIGPVSFKSKCRELWGAKGWSNFYDIYSRVGTEVVGGDQQVEMLFSQTGEVQRFSEWMETVKGKPGLISFSLLPLHMLLPRTDPRRNLLKQAIVGHISQRALKRDCPQDCSSWSTQNSEKSCTCKCQADAIVNDMCCAWERGRARLSFTISTGANLWGDYFSAVDAYVKVFFQDQERRTKVVLNNNNPNWTETIDFGDVTLMAHNTFMVELWDADVWHDDLLQKCRGNLVAGRGTVRLICYLRHGHIKFSYLLECGRTLGGPRCYDYVPLQLPTSYFSNSRSPFPALSLSHRFQEDFQLQK
ncbi:perforin-1-like [Anolis sagrei]|uniref:perforin-1-like n=1 Tax=Anolis sagrei TaxID=38937 RepID=UPI003522EE6C